MWHWCFATISTGSPATWTHTNSMWTGSPTPSAPWLNQSPDDESQPIAHSFRDSAQSNQSLSFYSSASTIAQYSLWSSAARFSMIPNSTTSSHFMRSCSFDFRICLKLNFSIRSVDFEICSNSELFSDLNLSEILSSLDYYWNGFATKLTVRLSWIHPLS